MSELRQHPRYAIELEAEVLVDGGGVTGRTRDISKGGFSMWGDASIDIGRPCKVRMALVFSESEFSEQLILPALVVWCTPRDGKFQLGVKFAPLDAQSRGYLELFIKFLEDGEEAGDDP